MGTRSNICIRDKDGSYLVIYCHWDGYPSHNGKILYEHYTTLEKVQQLIDLGSISSLGEEIGTKHDWDSPPKGECNAYGRDRGESDCNASYYDNKEELEAMLKEAWTEFVYVWDVKKARWYWSPNNSGEIKLKPLTPKVWKDEDQ